jgi:hypothetical protein
LLARCFLYLVIIGQTKESCSFSKDLDSYIITPSPETLISNVLVNLEDQPPHSHDHHEDHHEEEHHHNDLDHQGGDLHEHHDHGDHADHGDHGDHADHEHHHHPSEPKVHTQLFI